MIRAHQAFDVQTSLARITRLRVATCGLNDHEVLFRIGFTWDLALDEDDLRKLYNATDSDAAFRDVFDQLKPQMRYNAFKASR
ncbi:hypothetical protein MOP88_07360 [Sphingomonas sp. WKB10]|nr:hypothetical protein [Sphingomonas sp. WKB10]